MARKVRVFIHNVAQHVILKALSGISLFKDNEDYDVFHSFMEESQHKYQLQLHAYVLMPNCFEFLATPNNETSLSKFMQNLGQRYVRYFNQKYHRSGTLWEGRYKASLVEDRYLFDVMQYIEMLPVTVGIVKHISLYSNSSNPHNSGNKKDKCITPHHCYKALGYTDIKRTQAYNTILSTPLTTTQKSFIENALDKQSVTGTERYVAQIEQQLGVILKQKPRGRPKKNQTENKGKKRMYQKLVVLDKNTHKDLKVLPLQNLNFAKSSTFIPVVVQEVGQVGSTFPVVFTGDEVPTLVSLVGFNSDSLAINNDGKWITSYVPSFIRRYPFSIASNPEKAEQKIILIDEESPLVSFAEGQELFTTEGEQSEVLQNAMRYLEAHEQQSDITKNIMKVIAQSGILEEREIAVGEGDEKQVLVNGFKVVDREKLNALSDDILAEWVRKGIIGFIDAHIKSLDNIETLFKIAQQRQS